MEQNLLMKTKDLIEREKYVALHGQPKWFRVVKWIVIICLLVMLAQWKGWVVSISFLLCLMLLGTILHFVLRWKTKGWTQSWGPYKKMKLPK